MRIDAVIFIGPQGSGKGTQARILAAKLGFFYWEMGAIIRGEAEKNTVLGHKIKALNSRGMLLADAELLSLLFEYLPTVPAGKGIVFDGVPRRLGQAKFLVKYLETHDCNHIVTIFLDIPRSVSVARLLKRKDIENRSDDTPEIIERRLELYERETLPVLEFLRTTTTFFRLDGTPAPDVVTQVMCKTLNC